MEWSLWILGYLVIGLILTVILWKAFQIEWNAEAGDTKLLIIATPVGWPLVLLFIGFVRVFTK